MIVTLCGSARFEPWFHMWLEALGLAGHIGIGLASYPSMHNSEKDWYTDEEKENLDALHLAKIQIADAVIFLNVFGYMGESTLREFKMAQAWRKKVYALEAFGLTEGGHVVTTNAQSTPERAAARKLYGVPDDYKPTVDTTLYNSVEPAMFFLTDDTWPRYREIAKRLAAREKYALSYGGLIGQK